MPGYLIKELTRARFPIISFILTKLLIPQDTSRPGTAPVRGFRGLRKHIGREYNSARICYIRGTIQGKLYAAFGDVRFRFRQFCSETLGCIVPVSFGGDCQCLFANVFQFEAPSWPSRMMYILSTASMMMKG